MERNPEGLSVLGFPILSDYEHEHEHEQGARHSESVQRQTGSGGGALETPRFGYPFSVIRWTKGSRNTGLVAAGRGGADLKSELVVVFVRSDPEPSYYIAFA